MEQLVEVLRYKPEGRGFDPRWYQWNFSLIEVASASNRNEHQEYFLGGRGGRCVVLATLPPSWADCLEIRGNQPPGTLRACSALYRDCCCLFTGCNNEDDHKLDWWQFRGENISSYRL